MSRADGPEWVRKACGSWGKQKRRIWRGGEWHINKDGSKGWHVDGYANSLLGRIRDEGDGAAQGTISQHWPEVMWGDGLEVQRSLSGMHGNQHLVLHFHYVWDPDWNVTVMQKSDYMGIKRTEYFQLLENAETWVHARLASLGDRPDAQLVEKVGQIVRNALKSSEEKAINSQTRQNSSPPRLNLDALQRPRLALKRG